MIAYITYGADDPAAARRFYDAFLPVLGYGVEVGPEGISYVLPVPDGARQVSPDFYVNPTFNREPATAGNGTMVAFEARDQAQVRQLHAAGLAAGGTDEGQPGFRAAYSANFYVCYLRDPQGNKLAIFSSHPDDPTRED